MVKAYASDLITTSPTDREKTLNEETKAHDLTKPTLDFHLPQQRSTLTFRFESLKVGVANPWVFVGHDFFSI